ncbi:MAG: cobalamin-dependent protein [Aquabacterium sp.]|nr:cobalamin-dependent protein [Aquabacterium sp.]
MSRMQPEKTRAGNTPGADWHNNEQPDCWAEMQSINSDQGHAAWAGLASQRPAVEERLSRLVDTIERDIIPRLVRAHSQTPAANSAADLLLPTRADVVAFTAHVMDRDDAGIHTQLAELRARGVSVESIYVGLLAPAARYLGELWDDDRCHFAEVTVGMGRLQQIMRSLSTAFGTEIDPPTGGRRALLMPAPGDQHTFGLSMVAEFFARAGWEVVGVMDPLAAGFEDRIKEEWFDLVGISAGSTARLDGILSCIAKVRRLSHNRAVAVMVGGPLFVTHPELVEQLGADGVATDGQQAPALAERLLGRRVKGI